MRPPALRAMVPPMVRFVEQTDTEYAVGELRGPRTALVSKQRAIAETFPLGSREQLRARRLLRWSLYALGGAAFGGALGILLGAVVMMVALARLARFSRKVRRWRRTQRGREVPLALPAAATSERLCLLAALGQGVLAAIVGVVVLLLLVGFR